MPVERREKRQWPMPVPWSWKKSTTTTSAAVQPCPRTRCILGRREARLHCIIWPVCSSSPLMTSCCQQSSVALTSWMRIAFGKPLTCSIRGSVLVTCSCHVGVCSFVWEKARRLRTAGFDVKKQPRLIAAPECREKIPTADVGAYCFSFPSRPIITILRARSFPVHRLPAWFYSSARGELERVKCSGYRCPYNLGDLKNQSTS